jgi:signal transduction histidine kinase
VQLWGESDEIHHRVSDSDVGFDDRAARRGRGLGLVSMEERVKLVEGTSSIGRYGYRRITALLRRAGWQGGQAAS